MWGLWLPNQGSDACPLHWKRIVWPPDPQGSQKTYCSVCEATCSPITLSQLTCPHTIPTPAHNPQLLRLRHIHKISSDKQMSNPWPKVYRQLLLLWVCVGTSLKHWQNQNDFPILSHDLPKVHLLAVSSGTSRPSMTRTLTLLLQHRRWVPLEPV